MTTIMTIDISDCKFPESLIDLTSDNNANVISITLEDGQYETNPETASILAKIKDRNNISHNVIIPMRNIKTLTNPDTGASVDLDKIRNTKPN